MENNNVTMLADVEQKLPATVNNILAIWNHLKVDDISRVW